MKQWGIFNCSSTTEIKWPISFTTDCYAAVATTTPKSSEGGDSVEVTKTGFTTDPYYNGHAKCFCIAVGR